MAIKECKNGHYYNDSEFAACPYCSGAASIGHTVPLAQQDATPNPGATQYLNSVSPATPDPFGVTMAPDAEDSFGKTVTLDTVKNSEIIPVRGWLVVIEGEKLGLDFKIHTGKNSVGRAKNSDICIEFDKSISKEKACFVIYDEKHTTFHLMAGESTNNIYVNEEILLVPRKLEDNDIIEIGQTKLVFRSLCNSTFSY